MIPPCFSPLAVGTHLTPRCEAATDYRFTVGLGPPSEEFDRAVVHRAQRGHETRTRAEIPSCTCPPGRCLAKETDIVCRSHRGTIAVVLREYLATINSLSNGNAAKHAGRSRDER